MANKEYLEITIYDLNSEQIIETYVINYNNREERQKYIKTLHGVIRRKDWVLEILRIDAPQKPT